MHALPAVAVASVLWLAACASSPSPAPAASVSDARAAPQTPAPADATCEPKPPDPSRFPLDPVALAAGIEVPGSDALVEQSGAYSYAFANAENQAAFRADPARYEIQLGGACARMGPLSRDGNVTLHARHEGKLYLFASKACRAAFLKAPENYLEVDDPTPSAEIATPEARERGAALLAKALTWMGGAEAVDSVRTLSERRERDEMSGERTYHVTNELQLDLSRGWARENECWDAGCFGNVIGPAGAFRTGKTWNALVPVQRVAFERQVRGGVLATLRRRLAPDAIVYWSGDGTHWSCPPSGTSAASTGYAFDMVTIWSEGAETHLEIQDDGAILGLEHGARHGTGRWRGGAGFKDWRPCGAIRLPFARDVWSGDRDEQTLEEVVLTSIEVDAALDPRLFVP